MATAAHEMKLPRHRVVAAVAQRLATQQAPRGQQAASAGPEADHRNPCIIGATGVEAAALAKQRAEPALVQTKQPQYQSGRCIHVAGTACSM